MGARAALKRLRREYAYHKDVRDKLASRRQAAAMRRVADLRQTVAMNVGYTEAATVAMRATCLDGSKV